MLNSPAPTNTLRAWLVRGIALGRILVYYRLAIVLPVLIGMVTYFWVAGIDVLISRQLLWDILFWTAVIGIIELLPVPAWRSLQVSVALPLFISVAFLYPPPVAGMITVLASSDPRELRGEVTLLHALFNRCQAALAVLAASAVFHGLGHEVSESLVGLLPIALGAVLADYIVNVSLVAVDASLMHHVPLRRVLSRLRIGNPGEFAISYIGLGFLGLMLARLHDVVGQWAVAAFVMPLLLARQMFFRTRALEDAAKALQDREVVLRALSNRMAEERQDERLQIAGYLHDDLAQLLYRMSLHIDISQKHLEAGDPTQARAELAAIRETKDRTLTLIRSMIKDLRRSPLGRAGLVDAIASFCIELEREFEVNVSTSLEQVEMPPPIQLLCYQVMREAVMNAVKHAEASTLAVRLEPTQEGARLTVADDGKGFDVEKGSPEGHFGLAMMRERAQISGGSLDIQSTPGEGTVVTAEFRTSWLSDQAAARRLGLPDVDDQP
jgi:signal transduction histidine kinase